MISNKEAMREEEKVKEPIYRSTGVTGNLYAIFRISERKYKTIAQIRHYQNHSERLVDTPNADISVKNEMLVGSSDIVGDVKRYIHGIKVRKNGVLARDLLLTASPSFFNNITELERRKWVDLNLKWLKDNFGDNCVYATLHKDEKTWHISALVVPKFYNEKKGTYALQNYKYFDGIEKLRGWQDNYALSMQEVFKSLNRGVKFSKAKHIEIRHYYAMINAKLSEDDINQVCAKARSSELLGKQVKELQGTLKAYQKYSENTRNEKDMLLKINGALLKSLEEMKKDKAVYTKTIKALSEIYKIPQSAVIKVITHVETKLSDERNNIQERELGNKESV